MVIAGATQIGVVDDGAGIAGRPGGLVIGDEGGDALAGQPADLDRSCRDRLGMLTTEIPVEAQNAKACADFWRNNLGAREDIPALG